MRVLIALSSFLLGVSLAVNLIELIPDVDLDNEDCLGDACFLRNQLLSVVRSKTDPKTNLTYNEISLDYANTKELLLICLPNVAKEAVADSFTSCKDKKMEDICVFTKRGWLVKDAQEESVANVDFFKTAFSGLAGGDEAVKKCLNIKEETEEWDDDYEYYDYDDYYDEFLEEGAEVERRLRREAGNGKNNKNGDKNKKKNGNLPKKNGKNQNIGEKGNGRKSKKDEKKKSGKNNGKKGNGRKSKKDEKKKSGKNNGKKGNGRKSNKEDEKKKSGKNNGKNGEKKNGKDGNNGKPDSRKYVKKPSKKPSAENVEKNLAKINGRLNKLGLSKLPVKSTLDGLECMWNEVEDLLVKCGEKIISNSQ